MEASAERKSLEELLASLVVVSPNPATPAVLPSYATPPGTPATKNKAKGRLDLLLTKTCR